MLNKQENLAELIIASLKEMSDKEAIFYKLENGESISFSANDVVNEIEETGKLLVRLGLKNGDRILIAAPVSPYYLIGMLGAIKAGIVPIMIDYLMVSKELEEILDEGEIKTILTINTLIDNIPRFYLEKVPIVDITKGIELSNKSVKKVSYNLPETTNVHPETAFILYSSGTTSKRKGVEITHLSEILTLKDAASKVKVTDYQSNMLAVLPFSHIAGLTTALSAPYYKSKLYMIENVSATKIASAFQEFDIQYVGLIPKIYEAFMMKAKEAIKSKGKLASGIIFKLMDFNLYMRRRYNLNIAKDLLFPIRKQMFGSKLENFCAGGTALSKEIMDFYTSLGYTLMNVYASTETSVNMISTDWSHYDSSVTGKPLNNYVHVKVTDCDKEGVGELVVKSPCLFYGYFKDEKATKNAYTDDGYFRTGDLAKISEDGGVTIVGRRKEAILLENGEKVSPETIEENYTKLMGELSYAVCGVQLDKDIPFDTVFMFIEGDFTEKEKADINQKLLFENGSIHENYRIAQIRFVKELPKTSVGKVKRFELKELAIKGRCEKQSYNIESEIKEEDSFEGKVRTCIRRCSILDLSNIIITNDMNLYNDLGYDSLRMFQLSTALETEFKIDVSEYFTADLTVQDIYNLLQEKEYKKVDLEYQYNIHDYPQERTDKDEKMFKRMGKIFNLFYKTEYVGWENVPKNRPVILCPNHISELDPMVLLFGIDTAYREHLYCICWDKFTATKKGRYFMKLLNGLPIDRRSIGNPAATLKLGHEYLQSNKSLVIFPEGTRTFDGKLGTFQNGAACIAQSSNAPIIPVTLVGMYDAFSKTRKRYRFTKNGKRIKIQIIFSKPIYGVGLTIDEFTEQVKRAVNKQLQY